jgi:hypothetical protein
VSEKNVLEFLGFLATMPDLVDQLKTVPKAAVIEAADSWSYPFTEDDFNTSIWNLELRLATARGEQFDQYFGLWQTLWGQTYLEYLVFDLVPALRAMALV